MIRRRAFLLASIAGLAVAATGMANQATAAEKKYGPGVSDTEIKLGQTMPYSGPASAYGIQGTIESAYFKKLNEKGGVNGRKINLISLDDGYSPPKTVEQTRKLVENDDVMAIFGTIGTPTNTATHRYLNGKKVPQVMISTGASKWNDPKNFPWTTAFYPLYDVEGAIYGRYIVKNTPNAKIAILSQNDDAGRDYVRGFKEGLGDKAKSMVVSEATYEVTDATVDSQMVKLKNSGADVFYLMATPKFGAQAIRKRHEMGWKAQVYVVSVSSSIGSVMKPAGFEAAQGIVTATALKTPGDPKWKDSPDMIAYAAFMKDIGMENMFHDSSAALGYLSANVMQKVLEACGNELTRENLMKQLTNLNMKGLPIVLPGVVIQTTPENYSAFNTLMMQRFKGEGYELFGEPISAQKH